MTASASSEHFCGLRSDSVVDCWGENYQGRAQAPGGQFTAVTAGVWNSCGVRTDGTIDCWGLQPVLPPPDGVELVRPR